MALFIAKLVSAIMAISSTILALAACSESQNNAGGDQADRVVGVPLRCQDRVETAARLMPKPQYETTTRSIIFQATVANYATTLRGIQELEGTANSSSRDGGPTQIKTLIFVRSSDPVKVRVPESQYDWLGFKYAQSDGETNPKRATELLIDPCAKRQNVAAQAAECQWKPYNACRWGITQFAGSLVLNFDTAPQTGRCAQIEILEEHGKSDVVFPFVARAGDCEGSRASS
jgi:hypothetical protein